MTPEVDKIHLGDTLEIMRTWPDAFVQCAVTSPPYWGLRDYGVIGQLGLESTPEEYTAKMVEIFREVRRVLKDDGVLWLNLGDSYNNTSGFSRASKDYFREGRIGGSADKKALKHSEIKVKDIVGIPWMVAFALRADGWYLRQDIIWSKPNPMPESVTDRCTKAHEYLFMLTKSARYYYDNEAIKEKCSESQIGRIRDDVVGGTSHKERGQHSEGGRYKTLPDCQTNIRKLRDKQRGHDRRHNGFNDRWDAMTKDEQCQGVRNKRSVWTVATQPFKEAHFATFPQKLIEPCILAGSRSGDTILDPFMGAGTTGLVACRYNRHFIGCELNAEYKAIADKRIEPELNQIKAPI